LSEKIRERENIYGPRDYPKGEEWNKKRYFQNL
jgi:hypothetical protein